MPKPCQTSWEYVTYVICRLVLQSHERRTQTVFKHVISTESRPKQPGTFSCLSKSMRHAPPHTSDLLVRTTRQPKEKPRRPKRWSNARYLKSKLACTDADPDKASVSADCTTSCGATEGVAKKSTGWENSARTGKIQADTGQSNESRPSLAADNAQMSDGLLLSSSYERRASSMQSSFV
jgi:hypothetical protein